MAGFFDGAPATEASGLVGFSGNRIDRRSEHRSADSVAVALRDAAARLYLLRGDKVMLAAEGQPLFGSADATALGISAGKAVLLGWADEAPRLAAAVPDAATIDEAATPLIDLRTLASTGGVSPEHLGALAQARSLLFWHGRHGFCANCGARTEIANGGYRRDCAACGTQHFPRTDPVVIMLAIHGAGIDERVLLGRQLQFPPGMYSALAGFLEPGETIEAAVRRETLEESGIRIGRVRYHASQPWPFPAMLMIGCHAEALTTDIQRDATELEDCRWFSRAEAEAMLTGTHAEGFKAPSPIAIAHRLVRAWVER
jgi:NAD+ diphosphatase